MSLDAVGRGPRLVGAGIVRHDPHAEAAEDLRSHPADAAGAHDATGLAVEVEADQASQGEVLLAHAVVGPVDAAVEGQHQSRRVLGDRVGRIGRHAAHGHAEPASRRDIDVVEARAPQGHVLHVEPGERLEAGGIEPVVDERTHGRRPRGRGGRLGGQPKIVKHPANFLRSRRGQEAVAIVGLGVVDRDRGHGGHVAPGGSVVRQVGRPGVLHP
jgi:hypothetical protein